MQTENANTMTQVQLVQDLHLLGYREASVPRVAAWRKQGLLPPFTSAGEGRGRGAGRKEGCWSNHGEVLRQAEAILKLLKSYRRLEELYLPLWQLGYQVPLDRVRAALLDPLLTASEDFDIHEEGLSIEDIIDNAVWDIKLVTGNTFPFFDVPDETLAAALNVVANTEYNFDSPQYDYGVTDLRKWEQSFAQRCERLLSDTVEMNAEPIDIDNNIFRNAPFINHYLSLPHLLAAIQSCTDEDLMQVQLDLQVGREIVQLLREVHELMSSYLPSDCRALPDEITVIMNFGRLAIWVDLALRQQGFASLLNQIIPAMLEVLRENVNETFAKEIATAGPQIQKAFEAFGRVMLQATTANVR
jgi:hypothetical protein